MPKDSPVVQGDGDYLVVILFMIQTLREQKFFNWTPRVYLLNFILETMKVKECLTNVKFLFPFLQDIWEDTNRKTKQSKC